MSRLPLALSIGPALLALVFLIPAWIPALAERSRTPEADLASEAILVRSIDIADRDMVDLEPLGQLIGGARVVAIGESSHGAGSDFLAKGRLIRFLHERMGFDVVLWEAGIYDTQYLNAELQAGVAPGAAAKSALYSHWAHAAEVLQLLAYVQGEVRSGRPIDVAGFDLQISRPFRTTPRLIDDLREFFMIGSRSALDLDTLQKLEALRAASVEAATYAEAIGRSEPAAERFAPVQKGLAALAAPLLTALDRSGGELRSVHSPRRIALLRQMLRSLQGLDEIDEPLPGDPERPLADFVRRWNHREVVNTANIQWFVREHFPDRRIVIWTHNAHLAEVFATPDWKSWSTEPPADLAIRPSGSQIRRELGSELFSMTMTAYQGTVRRAVDDVSLASEVIEVKPAPPGSIEERLHRSGSLYAVLPLGSSRGDLARWLEEPRVGRIDTEFLPALELPWRDVADALFFSDVVRPSTITSP